MWGLTLQVEFKRAYDCGAEHQTIGHTGLIIASVRCKATPYEIIISSTWCINVAFMKF